MTIQIWKCQRFENGYSILIYCIQSWMCQKSSTICNVTWTWISLWLIYTTSTAVVIKISQDSQSSKLNMLLGWLFRGIIFRIVYEINCMLAAGYQAIPQPAQMRQTRPTAAPAPGAQSQVRPANMNARPITGQSTAQPRPGMAMPQSTAMPGRAPQQAQAPSMAPQGARPGYPYVQKPMPPQVGWKFIGNITMSCRIPATVST